MSAFDRTDDGRQREIEVALVLHLQPFIARHRLNSFEIGKALVGSAANMLLAVGQSHDDAKHGANVLADVLKRRVGEVSRR